MTFEWLQDKRLRFVVQWLPSILGVASTFAGLANQVGYLLATLIALVVALVLWIIANRAIEKISPQTTADKRQKPISTDESHQVCSVGPHKVEAGNFRSIYLSIKQGQRLKGHLAEIDNQPFDWFISDEKNMVKFKNGQDYNPIDEGHGDPAYRINRKIPWQARWYLILDLYGKQNYREVRVDFEPVLD